MTTLQTELLLEPFYRCWGIPEMETVSGYRQAFHAAGFDILILEDLSERIQLNWERGYQAALQALADPIKFTDVMKFAVLSASKNGSRAIQLAKDQFSAALYAKAAADSKLLHYVLILAERK